jgi:hypothetical protein
MKTLTIEQMEIISAGKINWACIGQTFDGVGVLGSVAFLLTASNPIGWGILAFSALGLAASIAADPTACDS